jgi:hypothetical protein
LWWLKKRGLSYFHLKILFSIHFDSKHLKNTLETLLNQFMTTKKPNIRQKTWNPPGTKILPGLRYVVLGVFYVKKTKRNPPHHIEHFDTKINHFGGWNLPKRPLSLSPCRNSTTPSLSS